MSQQPTTTFVVQKIIGPYVVDEIPPPLQITFKDCDANVIDLSSGYAVKFEIIRLGGTDPGSLGLGGSTLPDAVNGVTQYEWLNTDFQTAGMYRGVMWAANGTLRYSSIFYEWFVRDSLTTPGVS